MRAANVPLLATIAWRNVWRNRRRTLVLVAAITVGVWAMVFMTAFMRGMVEQMVGDAIANLTGHVQVHAAGYLDDPAVDNNMPAPAGPLTATLGDPDVKAWAARVRLPAVVRSERESAGVTLVGIDPKSEAGLSFIARAVSEGRGLESPKDPGILIGRKLAERLDTRLGRRVVLVSQSRDGEIADRGFRIVGIYRAELEATETAFVFVGRAVAQEMLKMDDTVSELALVSGDYRNLDVLTAKLRRAVPDLDVRPWNELDPYLSSMLGIMDGYVLVWFVVVFLAMSFGLVNTLLMAVFERTREIGLVQALGMSPGLILLQVLLESLFILSIGMATGNLVSWAALAPMMDGVDLSIFGGEGFEWAGMSAVVYPKVTAADVASANLIVMVLGLLASLYPAWRAARRVPIEAITRV